MVLVVGGRSDFFFGGGIFCGKDLGVAGGGLDIRVLWEEFCYLPMIMVV